MQLTSGVAEILRMEVYSTAAVVALPWSLSAVVVLNATEEGFLFWCGN